MISEAHAFFDTSLWLSYIGLENRTNAKNIKKKGANVIMMQCKSGRANDLHMYMFKTKSRKEMYSRYKFVGVCWVRDLPIRC